MPELHLSVAISLSDIPGAAAALETFAREHGIAAEVAAKLVLALDEVLTNIVSYGYPDGGRHGIAVHARLDGGLISLSVRDGGKPFDPLALPPPDTGLGIEERRIGGLGIHFVRTVMDEVHYRRQRACNVLTMVKAVDTTGEGTGR